MQASVVRWFELCKSRGNCASKWEILNSGMPDMTVTLRLSAINSSKDVINTNATAPALQHDQNSFLARLFLGSYRVQQRILIVLDARAPCLLGELISGQEIRFSRSLP
jgi:hypothetical protein